MTCLGYGMLTRLHVLPSRIPPVVSCNRIGGEFKYGGADLLFNNAKEEIDNKTLWASIINKVLKIVETSRKL